jgi:hypothetical protein
MASPGLSTTIILSEIILLETVLIIGAGIYVFLKAKKKSKKLTDALKSFTGKESDRLNTLTNILPKPDHLNDEKYSETIKAVITNENNIFNAMANIIYQNDLGLIDKFAEELSAITKPCANLLPGDPQPTGEAAAEEVVIDVDNAIDDLLSDDDGNDPEKDPALDLSEASEPPTDETADDDGIAEIPSELLDSGITDTTDEFEIDQQEKPNSDESTTNN